MSGPPPPRLGALPDELCVEIIDNLDMESFIQLSQVNKQFRRLCDRHDPSKRDAMHKYLLERQDDDDICFACFTCLQPRSFLAFTRSQITGKRGANGKDQKKRWCVRCGLEKGHLKPGNLIIRGLRGHPDLNKMEYICILCKQLKEGNVCRQCVCCPDCEGTRISHISHGNVVRIGDNVYDARLREENERLLSRIRSSRANAGGS